MLKSVIIQPTFIPWLGYFDLIDQSDICVYLDHVQFDYRSWQHKNKIKDASQKELISVIKVNRDTLEIEYAKYMELVEPILCIKL